MIDLRLLLPAASAWLGAILVIVSTNAVTVIDERHQLAIDVLFTAPCVVILTWLLVPRLAGPRLAGADRGALIRPAAFGAGVGLVAAAWQVFALTSPPVADWVENRATATVIGVVRSDARQESTRGQMSWQSTRYQQLRITTRQIGARGEVVIVDLPMTLRVPGEAAMPTPGTPISVTGRLAGALTPDTAASITVDDRLRVVELGSPGPIDQLATDMRAGLATSVAGVDPNAAALVAGLSVGEQGMQSIELADAMRSSGLSHLTAVSGGNVAIVLVVVMAAARALRFRLPTRIGLSLVALTYFVILVRPQPSVLRAAVMGAIVLVGMLAGGRRSGPAVLATAVIILVVVAPTMVVSWGFALSVAATLGLIVLTPPLGAWLGARVWAARWPPGLCEALSITLAAQLATLPLLIGMGASVGWVGLPANLLAMPAVAPVTILGLIAAVASLVSPGLAAVFGHLAAWPAGWIAMVALKGSAMPFAAFPWPTGLAGVLLLIPAGVGFWWAHRWAKARWPTGIPRSLVISCAGAGALLVTMLAVSPPDRRGWPPANWILVACDVGQGDAIVLRGGESQFVVVDAGPEPESIDTCLTDLGVRSLAAVVLTHFHADHVNGLPGLLKGRAVGAAFTTIVRDPPAEAALVDRWLGAAGIVPEPVQIGQVRQVAGIRWQVLWPGRIIRQGSVPNNASVVLLVDISGFRILLPGDIEPEAQRAVMGAAAALKVDVVKVPHHGSRYQDPQFAAWTSGRIALISVGAGNGYGHPAPETIANWQGLGALVGRTDLQGDLAVVTTADGTLGLVTRG